MSAITNDVSRTAAPSTDAFQALSSTDFIDIMFTELTNQDPLAPNETKDLLEQVGIIRAIESDLALTQKLEDVVRQNEISSASSLIGKFVAGRSDTGLAVADFVDSVSVTRDGTILNLTSGFRVPLGNIDEIIDPDLITIGDPPPAPPEDDLPADEDGPADDESTPPTSTPQRGTTPGINDPSLPNTR